MAQQGSFIEINGERAEICNLFIHGVYANRLKSLISVKKGDVDTVKAGNILCKNFNDSVISIEDGNINEVKIDAVEGIKLISLNGNGNIKTNTMK